MNHKLLLIPLLAISIVITQPQKAQAADSSALGAVALGVGMAGLIPPLVIGLASTGVSIKRYTDDPLAHRTTVAYLGAIAGTLSITAGAVVIGVSTDGKGWSDTLTWGAATVGVGLLNTGIGIHSIYRIKNARKDRKVTLQGVTPVLLGRDEIEGMGLKLSLGW